MLTYRLRDGEGETYEQKFANDRSAIAFAIRSQQFTRPMDRCAAVHTFNGRLIWRS